MDVNVYFANIQFACLNDVTSVRHLLGNRMGKTTNPLTYVETIFSKLPAGVNWVRALTFLGIANYLDFACNRLACFGKVFKACCNIVRAARESSVPCHFCLGVRS